jgi:hypothetical protein
MGPTGTKVRNTQTDKSQYTTYVIQACIFAVAGDIFVLLMTLFALAIGWPGLFVAAVLATVIVCKRLHRILAWLCRLFGWTMPEAERINVLRWALVISFTMAAFVFASGWWEWLIARHEMLTLIFETIKPLLKPFSLSPLIVYLSLIGLWFIAAIRKKGIITAAATVLVLLTWTISQINYTVNFAIIWARARYLTAGLLIPPAASGVVLCYAMFKEMIAPNLNFILDPISWDQFTQAGGLLGLIFPRYIEWKRQLEDRHVRVAVEDENGNDKRIDFLDTPKMHGFARAVLNGASFNEDTAHTWLGYGRKRWEKFRDKFLDAEREWAVWKNEENHNEGLLLLGDGRRALKGCLPHSDPDLP